MVCRKNIPSFDVPIAHSFLFSCGGVTLSVKDGRIISENTFDVRLQYAFEAQVPQIRQKLFSEQPRVPKPVEPGHGHH